MDWSLWPRDLRGNHTYWMERERKMPKIHVWQMCVMKQKPSPPLWWSLHSPLSWGPHWTSLVPLENQMERAGDHVFIGVLRDKSCKMAKHFLLTPDKAHTTDLRAPCHGHCPGLESPLQEENNPIFSLWKFCCPVETSSRTILTCDLEAIFPKGWYKFSVSSMVGVRFG